MKTLKKSTFYAAVLLSLSLTACLSEEVIQPISLTSMSLRAGEIFNGEYRTDVLAVSQGGSTSRLEFGLGLYVNGWEEVGEEVMDATDFVSENTIADIFITADSVVYVSPDSVFAAGEDLGALFKVNRENRSAFRPTQPLSYLIGRKITTEGILFKYTSGLEQNLDHTFYMEVIMDDGQTFFLASSQVQVNR